MCGGLVVSSTYDRLRERNSVSWTWTLKTGRAFPSGPEFVKAWNPGCFSVVCGCPCFLQFLCIYFNVYSTSGTSLLKAVCGSHPGPHLPIVQGAFNMLQAREGPDLGFYTTLSKGH